MTPTPTTADQYPFLQNGGEQGELIRKYDWAATSVGGIDEWPASLRTTLGILLHSSFPMFLFWGPDFTCFYNDAYRPSLGIDGKHPAIGKNGKEVWPEIWDFIGPLIDKVMETGESCWFEDQYLPIYRNGKLEDVYWTFSYSPAYNDEGKIYGVFVTCTETTEKVKVVNKLIHSESMFHSLVSQATIGIILLAGNDMKIDLVNDAYGKIIGWKPEEIMGKYLFDVIPGAAEPYLGMLKNVRNTGEQMVLYDAPYSVLDESGENRDGFVSVIYQKYEDKTTGETGVMAICRDTTDQVTTDRQAKEKDEQVRAIIESAPFPIGVYTGREMKITLANKSILDVWGKGNDVIGKLYAEILPELEGSGIYEQLDDVFTTGNPYHAKSQRVDIVVDGRLQPFYFNYSFTPLYDGEGKIYGVMNTAADLTELTVANLRVEQSEKNFRNIILQAPAAMCIMMGPEHTVTVANDLMIEIWGKKPEEVMNKPIFEGLPDAKEQGLEALIKNVYETGERFSATEHPVQLLRNGRKETVYQNFVYEAYKDENGKILGVLATSVDVTEQALARLKIEDLISERTKELATANQSLQRSNAELAQFAYIASHDLQEPLRKVSTYSQMLEQNLGELDERSANYLGKIKSSASRMTGLIRDVLTYSQLSKESDSFEDTDLQKIIDEIVIDFELLITQKQAQIIYNDLPVLKAIPLQMSQMFSNLISNALKFCSAETSPAIMITSRVLSKQELQEREFPSDAGNYYLIRVADNGIGFDNEYAEKIFNIFQRLHGKAEFSGTGIGLAMCKKIVQNHNGEIYASSEEGHGAVFNIILPEIRSQGIKFLNTGCHDDHDKRIF